MDLHQLTFGEMEEYNGMTKKNCFLLCTRNYIDYRAAYKDEELYEEDCVIKLKSTKERACDYSRTDIRRWLNNELYEEWFNELERQHILTVFVNNQPESTRDEINEYCCENTVDKLFLPSVNYLINTPFGLKKDYDVFANITEETIARENGKLMKKFMECGLDLNVLEVTRKFDSINDEFEYQKLWSFNEKYENYNTEELRENAFWESEFYLGKLGTEYCLSEVNGLELCEDFPKIGGEEKYLYYSNGKSSLFFYKADKMLTRSPNMEGYFFDYLFVGEGLIQFEEECDLNECNEKFPIRPFMIFSDDLIDTSNVDEKSSKIFNI